MNKNMPTWADVVVAFSSILALGVSLIAWLTGLSTLRTSYRPVVRVAPTVSASGSINPETVILKNIGFGPTLSVMLYDTREVTGDPLGQVAIVEILGEGPDERHRQGRATMALRGGGVQINRAYRLIYQDIAGGWHETRFTARQQDLVVQLLGPLRAWHEITNRHRVIPQEVRERGSVVRAPEAV